MQKATPTNKLSSIKMSYISNHIIGSTLLDVGAGECHYGNALLEKNNNLSITAIDLIVPKKTGAIDYHQADLEKPIRFLEDSSFDTVFAFDIIEHVNNYKQLIKEMYRVSKKGAILIGSVPHDDDAFLPAYNLTFKHRSDITHKRYYTPKTLKATLEEAGFHDISISKEGGVSPHVIAEFFPKLLKMPVKKMVGLLRRIGMIHTGGLTSDLFFIARK